MVDPRAEAGTSMYLPILTPMGGVIAGYEWIEVACLALGDSSIKFNVQLPNVHLRAGLIGLSTDSPM